MPLMVRTVRFLGGERYRLLVDVESGQPLYYPNLFATSQIRNRSLSVAAMETALAAIKHFLLFCSEAELEVRIRNRRYFLPEELDAIRDHCQVTADGALKRPTARFKGGLVLASGKQHRVGKACQYSRLSTVANYFEWLVSKVLGSGATREDRNEAARVAGGLRLRRPRYRRTGQLLSEDRALSEEARSLLRQVIEPAHPMNPFRDAGTSERNYLIVKLAADLGLRSGELLGIRVSDIDFRQHRVTVHRRADDADDSRVNEPNAKTLARTLPVGKGLIQRLAIYITDVRSKVPNASRNEFLFVTHKLCSTQGEPISKETLKQVFRRLSSVDPILSRLHPHALRHTWNDEFSKRVDALPSDKRPTEAKEEQMRDHLMGWKQGSGSSATYNKRHLERAADAASLLLQERMNERQ